MPAPIASLDCFLTSWSRIHRLFLENFQAIGKRKEYDSQNPEYCDGASRFWQSRWCRAVVVVRRSCHRSGSGSRTWSGTGSCSRSTSRNSTRSCCHNGALVLVVNSSCQIHSLLKIIDSHFLAIYGKADPIINYELFIRAISHRYDKCWGLHVPNFPLFDLS